MDSRNRLDIRYVKLHFTAEIIEDTIMPKNKVSMLRGGMGEMLLRANCIRDRHCEKCDFESECIVRRTMYSKMEIQPKFMTGGDSVGYVLECEDYREEFRTGDQFTFQLILLGKTIVYFSQFLNAFHALGMSGVGKDGSRFNIISVTNSEKKPIMDGRNINMENYAVKTVGEYVNYRMSQIRDREHLFIKFQTPLHIKHEGSLMRTFDIEAITKSVARRIYMLDCFEGIDLENVLIKTLPNITSEKHYMESVRRYSFRKSEGMVLEGLRGQILVENISEEWLRLVLAGELLHIGKNTSFGFGRYRIKKAE